MERTGLVARIEEDLERLISLGKLPRDGFLPSEQVLARRHGVSRATAREALSRLAVRGLVVQHPGRRSRAVPLQDSVTLESLSVALHAEGPEHPERLRLLEGFFELRREMTVELLAACCEHASETELSALLDVCFLLEQKAPWEEKGVRAKREFELLRLAALAANRPGHFLLIQSLERSFWAMAGRLLPHLDCEAINRWALCAFNALGERNAQALRQDLPALLWAADERLLKAPASSGELRPNPSTCQTGSHRAPPAAPHALMSSHTELPEADEALLSACQTSPFRVVPSGEPSWMASQEEWEEVPKPTETHRSACQTGSSRAVPIEELSCMASREELPEVTVAHRSTCQTGSCQISPARGPLVSTAPRLQPDAVEFTQPACVTSSGPPRELSVPAWSPVPWGLRLRAPLLPPSTWAAGSSWHRPRGRSAWMEREMTWCLS